MDPWAWSLLAVGVCLASYASLVLALVIAGRHESARALAGFIPDCLVLCGRLLGDPRVLRTPARARRRGGLRHRARRSA